MYQATVKIKITGYKVLSFTGLYYEDYKKRPNLKKIKEEVERIHGEEKKQRILTFIKPCEGESVEFIERYLEAAKWKARREENHE